jgi:DNA polymerase elongation subunit (family B)
MTTFQILDSFAQDLVIEKETDTTREVSFADYDYEYSDDEYRTRRRRAKYIPAVRGEVYRAAYKRREMIIHLFGTTSDGTHIRINLEGFEPFFFVKLDDGLASNPLEFEARLKDVAEGLQVTTSYVKRKVLFGYTGGQIYTFAKLSVESKRDYNNLKNLFLTKENEPIFRMNPSVNPLEVFEANLDPMLRFFHLQNLQPCGWATIDAEPDFNDSGVLEINARWDDIQPCKTPPVAVAPFLVASWDIECYSENGEFPLPKKNYERIAKLLLQNADTVEQAHELLLNAILYPDNPPEGMDAIRSRSGVPLPRATVDKIFELKEMTTDLSEALESKLKDKDAALLALGKCLKALERCIPLAGDPVIQIGVVLQRGSLASDKHIFVLGSCDAVSGATVYAYKTEKELILGWAKKMKEWNVDVLMGYNTFGFDERYLWLRAEEMGLANNADLQALTRLQDAEKTVTLEEKFLSSSALGDNTMYIWSTHGRLQIDLYHYVKRSFPLASYKLDDVCQNFMSGNLKEVNTSSPDVWTLKTKTTSDIAPGRAIVLLDETGDCLVDKLIVVEILQGVAIRVEAPKGDDAADLALTAASAVKWAVVKDDVSPQEIFKMHRGSSKDRAKVAAYCIQDCVLVFDLYKKLDVFNNAMAMANACSVPIGYIFTRGQGVKIESLIFKECYEREQCIMTLPNPTGHGAEESYEGAIVLDPIPGFYFDSPVGVADFASLYPSTIISENISYDTLVWVKDYNLNGSFQKYSFGSDTHMAHAEPGTRWTDIQFDIWGTDPADTRKHPAKLKTGVRICRYAQYAGTRKGALPEIVQKLLATRKAKRKEAEKESDPFKKALLDAEQLAYKLTANSLYGQLGSPTFKIRLQHLAASVTAYGRKQILFAKDVIERFYGPQANDPRCSAEITYGDTDSLFVNFNVKNPDSGEPLKGDEAIQATMDLTEEAGKFVTRALKSPHDFEYDKVFYPFIIFSKKRYVGNKYEDKLDYYSQTSMGIATKRRDYAPLVKVIYGGALRILLTEKDIPKALTFIADKLQELVSGTMSLNLLTMSKSLRAEYKTPTPPAHKVLAERIKARDPGNAPASGERVQFIYVTPTPGQQAAKLQGDRVETPSYIRAKGLKPDYRFYIEHQLMNPIVQLFSLVADKIPGVVQPRVGWAKASESDKEIATTQAVFGPILAQCDKMSVRAFGASFFGTNSVSQSSATAARRPVAESTKATLLTKVQPKLGYFIDKMIVEKMNAEKKKRAKKNAQEE